MSTVKIAHGNTKKAIAFHCPGEAGGGGAMKEGERGEALGRGAEGWAHHFFFFSK